MNKRVNTDFAKLYCPSMWKSSHLDVDGFLTPCCVFFRDKDKKKRIYSAAEDFIKRNTN